MHTTPFTAFTQGNFFERGLALQYMESAILKDKILDRALELKKLGCSQEFIEQTLMQEFDINQLTDDDLSVVNKKIEEMF